MRTKGPSRVATRNDPSRRAAKTNDVNFSGPQPCVHVVRVTCTDLRAYMFVYRYQTERSIRAERSPCRHLGNRPTPTVGSTTSSRRGKSMSSADRVFAVGVFSWDASADFALPAEHVRLVRTSDTRGSSHAPCA